MLLAVGLTTAAFGYTATRPPRVAARPGATGSRPATVSLQDTRRDLGRTGPQLLEAAFPIRNTGGRRLVINELDTDCECGERSLRTYLIAPGETVDLIVTLDTRPARGAVANTVSFTTNDPQRSRLELTVQAFVDAPATRD